MNHGSLPGRGMELAARLLVLLTFLVQTLTLQVTTWSKPMHGLGISTMTSSETPKEVSASQYTLGIPCNQNNFLETRDTMWPKRLSKYVQSLVCVIKHVAVTLWEHINQVGHLSKTHLNICCKCVELVLLVQQCVKPKIVIKQDI